MLPHTASMLLFLISVICPILTYGQMGGGSNNNNNNNNNSPGTTASAGACSLDGSDATYTETIESASDADGGYIRRIVSSGCPNYDVSNAINPNDPTDQGKDYSIMAYPCFSDSDDYDVTCIGGDVGITVNGISILSLFPGTCGEDAVELEGDTFDSCSGHSNDGGNYHYHVTPSCLLDQLGDHSDVTEHSPIIGWAFDGFPVYGPHGPGGDLIYPCNHSNANDSACLDECGGTEQYEIDGFLYHYHIVGPIGDLESSPTDPLPDSSMQPYTIGCFKGVIYDWDILVGDSVEQNCNRTGVTSSFEAAALEGITEIWTSSDSDDSTDSSNSAFLCVGGFMALMMTTGHGLLF